jgi:hypothetical protein
VVVDVNEFAPMMQFLRKLGRAFSVESNLQTHFLTSITQNTEIDRSDFSRTLSLTMVRNGVSMNQQLQLQHDDSFDRTASMLLESRS